MQVLDNQGKLRFIMTPVVDAVYRELIRRANTAPWRDSFLTRVEAFLDRTGRFAPDDPLAGLRREAAWEDALCRGRLLLSIGDSLEDEVEKQQARSMASAYRGVFGFHREGESLLVQDVMAGVSFVVSPHDSIARSVVGENLGGLCEGRIVGTEWGAVMLPGVVFHDATATEPIVALVDRAKQLHLDRDDLCDALLHMDHQYRTLSRVRASYAYRFEVLDQWLSTRKFAGA